MTSELDEDSGYELVKRNGEVIANYPITELNLLKENFKDICSTSDFINYRSLDYFRYSIYFLEFLEYFLDDLHSLFPDISPYIKNKSKLTKNESIIMNTNSFKILIGLNSFASDYLYYRGSNLIQLFNAVKIELNKIIYTKLKKKEQNILIRLYLGFLYFLQLLIERPDDIDPSMTLFTVLKNKLLQGKLNKTQPMFNQSSLSMIYNLFEYDEMLEYKKDLLSKFRLFQRKYLSAIAKLRKIGPPNDSNDSKEKSREIKKELNKNKNVDYKAYEVFCKYVLSKEYNEDIYNFLAGIHKNSNGSVIHKNIKNNKITNIKATTKKTHHKEYLQKSKKILEMVEAKIKDHGDIIDKETKNQVEEIRKTFNSFYSNESQQFKIVFGNLPNDIIHQSKRIQIINKKIDNMIKEKIKQEKQRKQEQEKEKQEKEERKQEQEKEKQEKEEKKEDKKKRRKQDKLNFISNLVKNNSNIQKENNVKQMITLLLSKYTNKLKNKTLKDLKRKEILEIIQKLKAYKNSNL